MTVALWFVQAALMAMFLAIGMSKVTTPFAELNQMLPYTADLPEWLVRFIGVSEIAGALGIMLPALTRIRPGLTPLAAAGITTIMVLAMGFHVSRGEFSMLPMNLVFAALAAFVAWGRWLKAPIAARA